MLALKSIGKSTFAPKGMRSVYGVRIGNREVVGHGCNSQPVYKDDSHFPFPAIRFKERSPEIEVLREKEKGDWRQLSKTEKKTFYRTSFCQTFSEFQVNTGAWKAILGGVLFTTSFTFWCQIFIKQYVNEPMPESTSEESQRVQLQRMLDLQVNPIDGLSSQWDYEKGHWKQQ